MATETDQTAVTEEGMDQLLDPNFMSGKQIEMMKKMDEKNVDHTFLKDLFQTFITSYNESKN